VEAIFVGLMEENVLIDVLARLEKSASAAPGASPKITDALQKAVTDAVNVTLSAAKGGISKQNVADAVRFTITANAPELQLIADNPVVVSAEYEETGRILNDTDQVALAEHEMPLLRKLTLKLMGELDG
jgi:hypothetical protein